MYRVGELTERIQLLRKTATPDGAGGQTVAWLPYADEWAHVRPMSGRERQQAGRTEGSAMYLVVIRARTDVRENDAIAWGDRNLNIRFPRVRGSRGGGHNAAWLEIEAELGARI